MAKMPAVGVGVLVVKGDRILLIRRSHVHGSGSWSTPGGHLDFGEAPEDCAVRETMEETSVEIGNVRFLGITNDLFEEDGLHYITIWMAGEYLSGEPRINEAELSELGWYAWDSLPAPLFLPLQNLMNGKCYPVDAFSSWMNRHK
jgi:8-oxo-dGTP diphosphatase